MIRLSLSHKTFRFLFLIFGFPWFGKSWKPSKWFCFLHRRSRYTTQCFCRTQSTGRGTIEIDYECVPYHQDRTAETVVEVLGRCSIFEMANQYETKRTKPVRPILALHSRSRPKEANYFFVGLAPSDSLCILCYANTILY